MRHRGFTLIELLIVVAIIGILAAIAIPNFLQAQTRAKVARAKSELKTIATAITLYRVDNNVPPPHAHGNPPTNDTDSFGNPVYGILRKNITTPIDYLSQRDLKDPFVPQEYYETLFDLYVYTYHNLAQYGSSNFTSATVTSPFDTPDGSMSSFEFYGDWRACSYGPDQNYSEYPPNYWGQRTYDPTNGTISPGNIWYGEKPGFVEYIPGES